MVIAVDAMVLGQQAIRQIMIGVFQMGVFMRCFWLYDNEICFDRLGKQLGRYV
jgi:hypothetical protein